MKRRELMLLLASAMMAPHAPRAQRKAMPVIGILSSGSPNAPLVATFRQGLSETGYVEGQNLAIEYRWAEGHNDLARNWKFESIPLHRRVCKPSVPFDVGYWSGGKAEHEQLPVR